MQPARTAAELKGKGLMMMYMTMTDMIMMMMNSIPSLMDMILKYMFLIFQIRNMKGKPPPT